MVCPTLLNDRYGFQLCWTETVIALISIAAVMLTVALWIRHTLTLHNYDALPSDDEIEFVRVCDDRNRNIYTRLLSISIFTLSIIEVILEVYYRWNQSLESITQSFFIEHLIASITIMIAWLICTVTLVFASTKEFGQYLNRRDSDLLKYLIIFWQTSLILEAIRIYYLVTNFRNNPGESRLDIATLFVLSLRLLALFSLVIFTKKFNKFPGSQNSRQNVNTTSFWINTYAKIRKLFPFLWPQELRLQLLVLCCFVLLGLGRIVNVLVPYTYKVLVEDLTASQSNSTKINPLVWPLILVYTFFRFLQGGVGLLSSLQNFLWIPVGQYTSRSICVRMLAHLHSLSLQFHINSKTGEVLRVMDRGTSSIGSLISYLAFNIIPVFVDIFFAVIYFIFAFDILIAMIVFTTMALYIFFTVWITEWRTAFRRSMNDLDTASRGRAVDSLLNFETVKYFGNEDWEVGEYEAAIKKYQVADWKSSASLNLLNTAQNIVITVGLLVGLLVCAHRVVQHKLSIGDFVGFTTYLLQLYQPLNWFGTYYRAIQQNFVDMEKMLDLFGEDQAIKDIDGALDLKLVEGSIKFENVSFSYDVRQPVLKNLSFEVPAGQNYALVGVSGGGKSSILRLLFRFYEAESGVISIDGQDISKVTQKSLRRHIGVVPQDTVLFNDTISFNIKYGNVEASEAEVQHAAKESQIHDRIISFPDGYNTKVGERGLRLSGGEKQRIAMARTLLKNPRIILLDEATSALDNQTEMMVQKTLNTNFKNRTKIIVAHRLTTIVDADRILVIEDGCIVEEGTHEELLGMQGAYFAIWNRQILEKVVDVDITDSFDS